MPPLAERVTALATATGQAIKALRASKADDTAVVHITGAETISGVKVFGSAPQVPTGSLLANPVRRDDSRLSDRRDPNPHGHAQADVTGLASALAVLRQAVNGSQGDTAQGDTISSFPRVLAGGATNVTNGYLYTTGVVAASADSATKVRIALGSGTPAGGTMTFAVLVGDAPNALAQVATATVASSGMSSGGLVEVALSQTASWRAGQVVAVQLLPVGFSAVPSVRFAAGGGPGSALLNSPLRLVVVQSGQSVAPSTYSTNSGSGAGNAPWWALA